MLPWQFYLVCTFFSLLPTFSSSTDAGSPYRNPAIHRTVSVDPSGGGDFRTIQDAIDSVPSYNMRWICINIKEGTYREQVMIPYDKQFIYLKGQGKRNTYVTWDAHDSIATSATFTSLADNIIAKSITFVNTYNSPPNPNYASINNPMRTAVAATIQGDKSSFYRCGFIGFQDTLWDVQGRHYFKLCSIQGAVDFIFGAGQSLYERCTISVVTKALGGSPGYITAQARTSERETNGFVFKDCNIVGNGITYLGRPWRDHARVVFYNTSMSGIVVPQGWDPWDTIGQEHTVTFAEHNCRGLGSDTSRRVKWAKKLSETTLNELTSISFVDNVGWTREASRVLRNS